jgi:hypothetical protein
VHDQGRSSRAWLPLALLALVVLAPAPGRAQPFSPADLAGDWEVVQLATPTAAGNASSIRAYRGTISFDGAGLVLAGSTLTDDQARVFGVTGNVSVTGAGLVTGTLDLADENGPAGILALREGRQYAGGHAIIGAATVMAQVGLIALVKVEAGQTFDLADLGGATTRDWSYSELTPSNADAPLPGQATWVAGSITFHAANGCAEADLVFADGSVRSRHSEASAARPSAPAAPSVARPPSSTAS